MYKRILSIVLVMLMCLTLLPISAAASGSTDAIYSDGVVTVAGTGFTGGTSYTVRVVDSVNSTIKAMGQTIADGSGSISVSITTGVLETLENYIVYINNPDGTLAGSASIAASGSVEATYSDGVVTVAGTGFTSGTSYTVRVVDSVNSTVKAMGQIIADGSGSISVSITTGVLETLRNYVVYINNPDGTLAGSVSSIQDNTVLYTATIQALSWKEYQVSPIKYTQYCMIRCLQMNFIGFRRKFFNCLGWVQL
jgi:predicted aspartyl protease